MALRNLSVVAALLVPLSASAGLSAQEGPGLPAPEGPQPGQQHWVGANLSVFQPTVARLQLAVSHQQGHTWLAEVYGGSELFDFMAGGGGPRPVHRGLERARRRAAHQPRPWPSRAPPFHRVLFQRIDPDLRGRGRGRLEGPRLFPARRLRARLQTGACRAPGRRGRSPSDVQQEPVPDRKTSTTASASDPLA